MGNLIKYLKLNWKTAFLHALMTFYAISCAFMMVYVVVSLYDRVRHPDTETVTEPETDAEEESTVGFVYQPLSIQIEEPDFSVVTEEYCILCDIVSAELVTESIEPEYLGQFKITYYCPCALCCGKYATGYTSTGTLATEGRTVAVDPTVIPYGTQVVIDGLGEFIAEDCGGAIKGNIIDVFMIDHQRALECGVDYFDVYIVPGE